MILGNEFRGRTWTEISIFVFLQYDGDYWFLILWFTENKCLLDFFLCLRKGNWICNESSEDRIISLIFFGLLGAFLYPLKIRFVLLGLGHFGEFCWLVDCFVLFCIFLKKDAMEPSSPIHYFSTCYYYKDCFSFSACKFSVDTVITLSSKFKSFISQVFSFSLKRTGFSTAVCTMALHSSAGFNYVMFHLISGQECIHLLLPYDIPVGKACSHYPVVCAVLTLI